MLADGRCLGFAEFGDPRGKPVLYFHGYPGSRLEARLAAVTASRLRVRLIALERPGYGLSDFQWDHHIGDWPADVAQLADALKLDRFTVLGLSGGGPYAAACALKLPHRLSSVGIVSGVGPPESFHYPASTNLTTRLALFLARHSSLSADLIWAGLGPVIHLYPEHFVSRLDKIVAEADREVLCLREVREALSDTFREGLRSGSRGAARDLVLYARPWGFRIEDIPMTVNLWHGERDVIVPPAMGRFLQKAIPSCRATYFSEEGHFSLIMKYMKEVLEVLMSGSNGS